MWLALAAERQPRWTDETQLKARPVTKVEWYLMTCSFPDLNWARLRVFADGTADVFDIDGNSSAFSSEEAAHDWLLEDEVERLSTMDEEDLDEMPFVLRDLVPPTGESESAILAKMDLKWTGRAWEPRRGLAGR